MATRGIGNKGGSRATGNRSNRSTNKSLLDDKRFRFLMIFVVVFLFFLKGCNSIIDSKNTVYTGLKTPEEYREYEKSDLDTSAFFTDEYGFKGYNDGVVKYKRGIDVSEHQGNIDWAQVKAAGVEFAYIRLGYRTYDLGNLKEDSCFEYNIQEALANGLEVGVYFFSQASNVDEAIEEASFVVERINNYEIALPVAFDMEEVSGANDRVSHLSVPEVTEISDAFCTIIENYGYDSIIYTNPYWAEYKLDLSKLLTRKLWLAHYTGDTLFPYRVEIWQYSESGTVDGIGENVDLNIMYLR